jgi:hypothetical protein
MADPQFLKHLDHLRRTYHPHWLDITPVTLSAVEFDLKEVGRLTNVEDPHHYHQAVTNLLLQVCVRSLSMLKKKDILKLFDEIEELHSKKNAGYAGIGTTDAWKNFRTAQWFGASAFTGCLVRMGDKFIRVSNLSKNPACDQVGEAITDTLQDLAVYCLVAICLWDEERDVVRCGGGEPSWQNQR